MRLRFKILFAVVLVLLGLGLWAAMRGNDAKTALENYRKLLAARGEKLDVQQLAPHFTSDEIESGHELLDAIMQLGGNYKDTAPAMIMVAPGRAAVTWNQDVWPTPESSNVWLSVQQRFLIHSNSLETFRAALKQPLGGVGLDYTQGWSLLLPHLAHLKKAAIELLAASRLELHDGNVDQSVQDLKACIVFTHFSEREPIMISQLVRCAIMNLSFESTWEVLQHPGLNDRQLAELQRAWESAGMITNTPPVFEMERAMNVFSFEAARQGNLDMRGMVSGPTAGAIGSNLGDSLLRWAEGLRYEMWKKRWSYYEELCMAQTLQAGVEGMRDMRSNAPFAPRLKKLESESDAILNSFTNVSSKFVVGPTSTHNYLRKLAMVDTARELSITAIALRRYQVAHQHYPAKLEELVPDYLPVIPLDPMDQKPLRYHPNPDGTFLLYSIGADGVDDGGDPHPPKDVGTNHIYWTFGRDLVWPMPATQEQSEAYKKKTLAEWVSKHPVWKKN